MINKLIASALPYLPKKIIWIFSKKYIAGENIEDVVAISKKLNDQGIYVTIDLLGEQIKNLTDAEKYKQQYLKLIDVFEEENIKGSYSLKPSMFGLLIDEEKCYVNIKDIVKKAADNNNFVRIDMEDSKCTSLEIDLFKKLYREFHKNVGLVFQAYLKRTKDDINDLISNANGENSINLRLCKGIYIEPKEISFIRPNDINQNFITIEKDLFNRNIYTAIATHDKKLIDASIEIINRNNIPKEKFEFQMLYGVTPDLRNQLVKKGYKVRVYVPFGKDWFCYSTRRLHENPKIVTHIIKSLFIKN